MIQSDYYALEQMQYLSPWKCIDFSFCMLFVSQVFDMRAPSIGHLLNANAYWVNKRSNRLRSVCMPVALVQLLCNFVCYTFFSYPNMENIEQN